MVNKEVFVLFLKFLIETSVLNLPLDPSNQFLYPFSHDMAPRKKKVYGTAQFLYK